MSLLGAIPTLVPFQYTLVDNIFSMTVATMAASALFFFMSRSQVAPQFRPALLVSGIVVSIAAYHYFMIRLSWQGLTPSRAAPAGSPAVTSVAARRSTTSTATPTGS